jgi:diguanylate cyclase (GGDEF)-like protein/PAS domain S-box-containing protein
MKILLRLWHSLTAPHAKDIDQAQQEYLTKSLLIIMGVPLSFATLSILVGWGFGLFQLLPLIIILSLDFPVILAYWWAYHDRAVLASYIPTAICLGLAFYITYSSDLVSSGQLFSMIAILLAAMLQGIKTQWLVAIVSIIGYLTIGILRFHDPAPDLVAFGITISCAFAGTALLIGFYLNRLKVAFAEARTSEEQIRNLFERVPAGLYRTTLEGRIKDANPGLVEMLGYPDLETLLGITANNLYMNPKERIRELALLEQEGTVHGFQLQLRRYDGRPIWVRDTVRVIRDKEGKVLYFEGSLEDVTERMLAEQELKIKEARYRAIVEDQTELICRFLPDGRLTFVNEAYCRYFDKKREHLLGLSFLPSVFDEDRPLLAGKLADICPADPAVTMEHRIVKEEGVIRWHQWTNRAIYDQSDNLIEFQAVGRDITDQKQAEERLSYLATHDPLTNIPNRILLQDRLNIALERANRNKISSGDKFMVAVMMLDMDNFKKINDTLGHAMGDMVLQAAAERLRSCMRMSDTVARMGGDEFILVIGELSSPKDGALVAQKILSVVSEPLSLAGQELSLNASIGISLYPTDGENIETLLKNADIAMYRAKEGRNCYRFYSEVEFVYEQ